MKTILLSLIACSLWAQSQTSVNPFPVGSGLQLTPAAGPAGPTGATGATGPAGTDGAISQVQANGTPVTVRPNLNVAAGTNVTITPTDNGTNTTTLTISATGSGGGVTGVTGTSPITSTGGTAPAIGCATCGVTGSPLSQFAATTSAQLAGTITNETGTGALVFGTAPTITLANGTGLPLATGVTGLLPHVNIAATAVTPGSYTNANITVAADGSITAAANGTAGGSNFTYLNCDATGATDFGACLRTAVAGMGAGGTLVFQQGATYKLSSQVTDPAGTGILTGVKFTQPINVDFNGATINVDSSLTLGAVFMVWDAGETMVNGLTLKVMAAAHRGDQSITLTTHSDASTITPGHIVYMSDKTNTDLGNMGLNIASSADATTGVVVLAWPLAKDYTVTPRIQDAQVFFSKGYHFKGPGLVNTGALEMIVSDQVQDFVWDGIDIKSTILGAAGAATQMNHYITGKILNTTCTMDFPVPCIGFQAASTDILYENNTITQVQSSNGTFRAGECFVGGEGDENIRIIGNRCTVIGTAGTVVQGLDLTQSFDVTVTGNTFNCGLSSTACIMTDNGGSFACVNCVIKGNTIVSGSPYAIQAAGSLAATVNSNGPGPITVTDNMITVSTTIGGGIHCFTWCIVTGNSIQNVPAGYIGIILEGAASMQSIVSNNMLVGNSGSWGIDIEDPGSQQANDPVIMGNTVTGFTIPIRVGNAANVANSIVCGNGVQPNILQYCGSPFQRTIGASWDGGGVALSAGRTWYVTSTFACHITGWNLLTDVGSATVDVWKVGAGSTTFPTIANTIVAAAPPASSSQQVVHSTTLTGWSGLTVVPNEVFGFNLNAAGGGATTVAVSLTCN